jgi:hypothetical protein
MPSTAPQLAQGKLEAAQHLQAVAADEARRGERHAADRRIDEMHARPMRIKLGEHDEDDERSRHQRQDAGHRPGKAAEALADDDRGIDDVRAGKRLAKAEDLGKFALAQIAALLDKDATREGKNAAEAVKPHLEEGARESEKADTRAFTFALGNKARHRAAPFSRDRPARYRLDRRMGASAAAVEAPIPYREGTGFRDPTAIGRAHRHARCPPGVALVLCAPGLSCARV